MTTAQKPDALPVVAHLVTNLRSGEPSLCFEDERGDYGDEDHTPVFEALVLLTDAQASLLAKEAECEALREDAARTERNRDMWKGQCERQAESLTNLRGQRDMFVRLLRECLGPLEVSAAIFESDDAEPLEALIAKATNAIAAIDAARAAADQGGAS